MDNEQAMSNEANEIKIKIIDFEVNSKETMDIAGILAKKIKTRKKAVNEFFKPLVDKANQAHKALTSERKKILKPIEEADILLRSKMSFYLAEQERIRLELQLKQESILLKQQEEAQLALATQLEDEGEIELANEVLEEKTNQLNNYIQKDKNPEGISTRLTWKYEVTDLLALVKAVANSEASLEVIDVKDTVMGALVRSLKDSLHYPGVLVYSKKTVTVR